MDCFDRYARELDLCAGQVVDSVPDNFFSWYSGRLIPWDDLNNRDFIRVVSLVGEGYYRIRRYEEAELWITRAIRLSDVFEPYLQAFLVDLEHESPTGIVHELSGKQRSLLVSTPQGSN